MFKRKHTRAMLACAAALAAALVTLETVGTSADVGTTAPPSQAGFAAYVPASGPELTATAVGRLALGYARSAGDATPSEVTATPSTFSSAQAVMDPSSALPLQTSATDAVDGSWLGSPAYLVVMHGHFVANLPVPEGHPLPSGPVYALILDAHTGFPEGRYLGRTAPDPSTLGPVTEIVLDGRPIAEVARLPRRAVGSAIEGRVSAGAVSRGNIRRVGSPAIGWRVVVLAAGESIRSSHVLASGVTGRGGRFVIPIGPGRYLVDAHLPNGTICLSGVDVRVAPGRRTYVELGCSLP